MFKLLKNYCSKGHIAITFHGHFDCGGEAEAALVKEVDEDTVSCSSELPFRWTSFGDSFHQVVDCTSRSALAKEENSRTA